MINRHKFQDQLAEAMQMVCEKNCFVPSASACEPLKDSPYDTCSKQHPNNIMSRTIVAYDIHSDRYIMRIDVSTIVDVPVFSENQKEGGK